MKYKNLYTLTKEGEEEFKKVFFDLHKFDSKKLIKKKFASPILNTKKIEIKNFKTSYQMAEEVSGSLGGRDKFWIHQDNHGLWKWITWALYHQILEGDGKGGKKTKTDPKTGNPLFGQPARYRPAPMTDYLIATRHIVRGALFLHAVLGKESEFILSNPLYKSGEIREQISQTALLVQEGIALTFKELYWNEKRKNLRRGHARQGKGGARDLVRVLKQLMVTYGIEQMDKDQIIDLLPKYFDEEWLV